MLDAGRDESADRLNRYRLDVLPLPSTGLGFARGSLPADCVLPRLAGHRDAWLRAVSAGLRHRGFVVTARIGDALAGVVPLLLVKGPIFGRFLVSLPYLNSGGVWARDVAAARALVDRACDLADELDVRYLELRHEVPVEHQRLNQQRTDKVHMRLTLPESDEVLEKSFKSKLRSQIRKCGSHGHSVHFGSLELLDDFYRVFAVNMRDLGTPVFSKRLFAAVLEASGEEETAQRRTREDLESFVAEICLVRIGGRAIAGALLVHCDGVTEVPSASSLKTWNHTGANMWMYRHLLGRAIEMRSHTFDFGRSSRGSGTYKFKEQWGAVPYPAVWQYYLRSGSPESMRPDAEGNQRLIRLWQQLPVWLTRTIGPAIVRGIP
jgi:FemAB-related protein (PEP-CTERM system-associated)